MLPISFEKQYHRKFKWLFHNLSRYIIPTCYSKKCTENFNQSQNKGDSKIPSEGKKESITVSLNWVLQHIKKPVRKMQNKPWGITNEIKLQILINFLSNNKPFNNSVKQRFLFSSDLMENNDEIKNPQLLHYESLKN